MKKRLFVGLLMVLLCALSACGAQKQPEEISCGHEAYKDLIALLERKDFDGARTLIDILEGREMLMATESEMQPEPVDVVREGTVAAAEPETVISGDFDVVELTKYNVKDYFEFKEIYYISARSQCQQYIALKEEYKDRLITMEDVKLEVSYLLCEAYGEADLQAERFKSEYYDILSQDAEVRTLKPDSDGIFWINHMLYFQKGCFTDFAMDVEIRSGSGRLFLQ